VVNVDLSDAAANTVIPPPAGAEDDPAAPDVGAAEVGPESPDDEQPLSAATTPSERATAAKILMRCLSVSRR
jgi:hypothetical protein